MPTVVFFSAFVSMLFHIGVLQVIIMGRLLVLQVSIMGRLLAQNIILTLVGGDTVLGVTQPHEACLQIKMSAINPCDLGKDQEFLGGKLIPSLIVSLIGPYLPKKVESLKWWG